MAITKKFNPSMNHGRFSSGNFLQNPTTPLNNNSIKTRAVEQD
jgi:hypothetical protein